MHGGKKNKRKFLAVMLSCLLALSLVPITALAEESFVDPATSESAMKLEGEASKEDDSEEDEEDLLGEDEEGSLGEDEEGSAEEDELLSDEQELLGEEAITAFDVPVGYAEYPVVTLTDFDDALATIEAAGGEGKIILQNDIELDTTKNIPSEMNLILSGLSGTEKLTVPTSSDNMRHLRVGGSLYVEDIIIEGHLSSNKAQNPGAGGLLIVGGLLEMYDGAVVTKCSSSSTVHAGDGQGGGGVRMENGSGGEESTFNMHGGQIIENETALYPQFAPEGYPGGGGVLSQRGTINMYGGEIARNKVIGDDPFGDQGLYSGGGILAQYTNVNLFRGSIDGNQAYFGGGVNLWGSSSTPGEPTAVQFHMYDGAKITNNFGVAYGGGIHNDGIDAFIHGGNIDYNRTYFRGGGYFNMPNFNSFTMYGGSISHNRTMSTNVVENSVAGGGLHLNGMRMKDENCIQILGGTIAYNSTAGAGGGVYMFTNNDSVSNPQWPCTGYIKNTQITGNTAGTDGGGVYLWYYPSIDPYSHASTIVDNCTFSGNYAGNGAKLFDLSDTVFYNIHEDNVTNLLSLSSPFNPAYEDSTRLNKAYNNFDINYPNGDPLTTTEIRLEVDGSYWMSIYATYGKPANDPTSMYPLPSGKTLYGWYNEATYDTLWDFSDNVMTNSPMTLYAYTDDSASVIENDVLFYNNHSTADDSLHYTENNVEENALVPAPADPAREGYDFLGWATARSSSTYWSFTTDRMPSTELKLYAQWQKNAVDPGPGPNPDPTPDPDPDPAPDPGPEPRPINPVIPEPDPVPDPEPDPDNTGQIMVTPKEETKTKTTPQQQTVQEDEEEFRGVTLFGSKTPLGGLTSHEGWSLLSLIFALLALVGSVIGAVNLARGRKEEKETEDESASESTSTVTKNRKAALIVATVLGIVPLILFFVLENFTYMVLISAWTPLIGVVFVVHLIVLITALVTKRKDQTGASQPQTTYSVR